MKFIVVEIQKNPDGAIGSLINAYDDRNAAEAKYHTVLAAAAASTMPVHSCAMLTEEGTWIKGECYKRGEEPVEA